MVSRTDVPVHEALFGVAGAAPDRPCLVLDDGSVCTYGDLDGHARLLAGALHERGVRTGDRLVAQTSKSADAVALYLACLRSGVVYVPLNTAYTAAEVSFFVEDAAAALFVDDSVLGDLRASSTQPVEATPRRGSDAAAMLYTSGTTGRSKGALLSCRNLVANAHALHDAWRFRPDDVLLHVLPVFHVHGLFVALHCAWLSGAAVRFHERFDVDAVRRDLPSSTVMMGVPTHYHRLLADPAFGDECAGMRLFTSGSAPLPASAHDEFARRTGHRIVERYGMTETMILTSNPYDADRVAGTVGFPLPGVDLRVVDEEGSEVSPGVVGTVEVRSDGVFLGYWGLDAQTAACLRDGWFVTGDLGSLDGEGRLTLVGRAGDMIISGGFNVYPKEIEAVLDSVDGVAESAVVGAADPDLGETVVAFVVLEPGEAVGDDVLSGACVDALARFKHPRRYVRVDALPRNAMGKVQKATLRQELSRPPQR